MRVGDLRVTNKRKPLGFQVKVVVDTHWGVMLHVGPNIFVVEYYIDLTVGTVDFLAIFFAIKTDYRHHMFV
jgi:hypothetical protein